MTIEVIAEQPSKAPPPILVTEFGIVIEVRHVQPEKADSAMLFVPSFITIFVLVGIVPLYL